MSDIFIELVRLAFGVTFGLLGLAFAISTFRLLVFGQDAYRANKRITPKSPWSVWSGKLKPQVEDIDRRASHGIAMDLDTGQLQEQRRLSTEAIDDVIGRRAI